MKSGTAFWIRKTTTQIPIKVYVASGRPSETAPPKTVRTCRVCFEASRTQSTHWMPTAAGRWHSGQTGRSQRWQRT